MEHKLEVDMGVSELQEPGSVPVVLGSVSIQLRVDTSYLGTWAPLFYKKTAR